MDLRVRVFCEEQGVDAEEEMDGLDDESHFRSSASTREE